MIKLFFKKKMNTDQSVKVSSDIGRKLKLEITGIISVKWKIYRSSTKSKCLSEV